MSVVYVNYVEVYNCSQMNLYTDSSDVSLTNPRPSCSVARLAPTSRSRVSFPLREQG